MSDRHDYVALEWVKGEIGETLKQARQALEAFVENPQDPTRMRFCLTYVHQVHGTLQMVEFYGAALLAEEMEQLAKALMEGRVANQGEALEVLMQAILQLPVYLDRIQTARRDLPMVVLPLLNDLRAARGEKLLSETSLFAPDMSQRQAALSSTSDFDREKVESIKQAIAEGFILDVIKNYTPVDSFYRVAKTVEDDPDFDLANHLHRVALPGAAAKPELETMVNELTAKQVELNTAFVEKATQHSQDFVKFARAKGLKPRRILTRHILRYPYNTATGEVGPREVFIDTAPLNSAPDGATVDAEGGLWVALVQTAQLARFFADGRLDRLIDCPVPFVTCPCFGGESLDTIYLTSIRDSGNLLRTDHPQGGSLMAIRGTGARGLPEVRFNDRGL